MAESDQELKGEAHRTEDLPKERGIACEASLPSYQEVKQTDNQGPSAAWIDPQWSLLEWCIRYDREEYFVDFTKRFEQLRHGSCVLLPELQDYFDAGFFFVALRSFPDTHEVVKTLTENVQLRHSNGLRYIFKKERWAEARCRDLEQEIKRGFSYAGICKVLGLVKQVEIGEDFICFLLEYCEGKTLLERVLEGDWNITEAKWVLRTLMKTMTELESRDVMITDLKPENICFRSEDPQSLCLVDLESMVDLTGTQTTYSYTPTFSPPFRLDLSCSLDDKRKQMVKWHRWSVGTILANCLPPFNEPWKDELERCGGEPALLHDLIINNHKGIRRYLPMRRPPNDHWRPTSWYKQLLLCMGGLLDLDPALSIQDCLDYAVFTDATSVQLVIWTPSGRSLGCVQVEPGTSVEELLKLQQFQALVPEWRKGSQLRILGRALCPTTACFFKNEMLTVCPPPQASFSLLDRTSSPTGNSRK